MIIPLDNPMINCCSSISVPDICWRAAYRRWLDTSNRKAQARRDMKTRPQRILHLDGDAYFASCEVALDPKLRGKPVFVGGGRRGDGIVIAANYLAKQYGIKTGMACFEARRQCPTGVLVKPHYDEYRRLSVEMFRRARHYTPLLVPTSIDEGFMDFTDSPSVFRCRNAGELVTRLKREIANEVGIPVSVGLGSSRWLAKLATESCKPDGFREVSEAEERAFLKDLPVQKLAGIAERRARSLRALGVWSCGYWRRASCANGSRSPTDRAPALAARRRCPTTSRTTTRRCCSCSTRRNG
jgi:nucleotidyltransferase/DNA polymerase involved in DNA repair